MASVMMSPLQRSLSLLYNKYMCVSTCGDMNAFYSLITDLLNQVLAACDLLAVLSSESDVHR